MERPGRRQSHRKPRSDAAEFRAALQDAVRLGYLRFHPDDIDKPLGKRRLLKGPVPYTPPDE